MYSVLLIVVAIAGGAVALYAGLAWSATRSTLLLFCVASLGAVVLETLCAGAGNRLGAGPDLLALYTLPKLVAAFAWPLSLYTMATLARRLGHGWARIDWGHGAVCLFAAALLVYGLVDLWRWRALQPACWQDVLWYARSVPPALSCGGAEPSSAAGPGVDVVLLAVLAGWVALGAGIWRQERRAGLLGAVLAGAVLLLLPAGLGPLARYLGLTLAFAGIALEARRQVGVLTAAPPPP